MGDRSEAFYNSARQELIQRITLRDQALFAYIVTIGAYFGFVQSHGGLFELNVKDSVSARLSLMSAISLPFISLTFTLVVLQHNNVIGFLSAYIDRELFPNADPPHWDSSTAMASVKSFTRMRSIAQALILCGPALYGAGFYASNIGRIPAGSMLRGQLTAVGSIDAVIVLIIVALHLSSHRTRQALRPVFTGELWLSAVVPRRDDEPAAAPAGSPMARVPRIGGRGASGAMLWLVAGFLLVRSLAKRRPGL